MKTVRLTMAQALVRFLENQYMEVDGAQHRFVRGVFIIPGHGNVVGLGQALSQEAKHLEIYQGKNEQGMAQAAVAFAKQMKRKQICVATSSVGPGAANMVTACGTATANNIPLLVLPGDPYACRQPDPVLQQVEHTNSLATTTNDAFKAVCRYWDRVVRPEQLMSAMINAFRVLTDPANTGAVCVAMPQDVEGEAYDYPVSFFAKRVWRLERRPATEAALADAAEAIRKAKRPMMICGGGVRYSEAHAEFLHFAETFGIPYGETQAGKSATDWLHPLNLGGVGTTGCSAANDNIVSGEERGAGRPCRNGLNSHHAGRALILGRGRRAYAGRRRNTGPRANRAACLRGAPPDRGGGEARGGSAWRAGCPGADPAACRP